MDDMVKKPITANIAGYIYAHNASVMTVDEAIKKAQEIVDKVMN